MINTCCIETIIPWGIADNGFLLACLVGVAKGAVVVLTDCCTTLTKTILGSGPTFQWMATIKAWLSGQSNVSSNAVHFSHAFRFPNNGYYTYLELDLRPVAAVIWSGLRPESRTLGWKTCPQWLYIVMRSATRSEIYSLWIISTIFFVA